MEGQPGECVQLLPHLFIGNIIFARNSQLLLQNSITHVLNLTTREVKISLPDIKYKNIPLRDTISMEISENNFFDAFDFINSAQEGQRVLVHCAAGVSRYVPSNASKILSYVVLSTQRTELVILISIIVSALFFIIHSFLEPVRCV